MLQPVEISPIGFAYICATTFSESFKSLEDLRETVQRFEQKKCTLYVWENRGFLIVSWHEKNGRRWLEVEQGTGKHFYTRQGMDDLIRVGIETGCMTIICRAEKPLVIRLLKRLGFEPTTNDDLMKIEIGGKNE
jgi:hypothetical protein